MNGVHVYLMKKKIYISAISGVHVFNLIIIHVLICYMYINEREIDVKGGSIASASGARPPVF